MGMRAPEDVDPGPPPPPLGPSFAAFALLSLLIFVALVVNGRAIGAGDTRPTERVSASLVQEGDLDLDEYPEVTDPFARTVGEHRVSIYPVLSAVLAAPVFFAAKAVFLLDETGTALAGKLAAALLSSLAAGVLFLAIGRRRPHSEAAASAAVFALGTTVWATSQALWQHPAAVLFLSLSVLWAMKAEDDEAWAGRAGLPLALAVAARHAGIGLALALAFGIAARWPRRIPHMLLWAAPVVTLQLAYQWLYFGSPVSHGFSGGLARFSAPWGEGHLGLLVSPGKGLVFFTPVALIAAAGLVRALIRGERWLAVTLGAGVVAHWLVVGRWAEWHGGESWGPRLLTDALPFLFVFLSDGLDLLPRLGVVLAAISVGVQALGAFAYDYRWERLYQRPPTAGHPELWQPARSPILFHLEERVLIFARPGIREGRAVVYEHRKVPFGPEGSRIDVGDASLSVGGEPARFGDVHLQRGARVEGGRIRFERRWDGLFLRVRPQARARPFELRIEGRGRGTLYVGEQTFWSKPRFTSYPMAGSFSIRHPYDYPESGGPDVTITIGRAAGNAAIASVALIDPRAAGP